jgi:formylglycine-generating enzyme required for sulfatase activity
MVQGPERLVLQACRDLPKDKYGCVDDAQISQATRLPIADVKTVLECLEEKGFVSKVQLATGQHLAYVTAQGTLELSQSSKILDETRKSGEGLAPIKIVPKGLRSFDADDKDFFLDLLPGPRRADGLPESIHFWKVRIEEMDPDKTFRVGYIFGPSGCGKSSLVKAGLLPRLSKLISAIYIEATGEETETRLLRGLRKQYPELPAEVDLRTALVATRNKIREGLNKILLVIDQFEQWYQAKGAEPETELAKALSECDGGRVQAIILVRDDYSMALHRFMAVIGVRQNQDQNFAVVDLFDLEHARKVLLAFGRGYGKLPDDPEQITSSQNEFLDRTIKGLSQEGRVVSVRLALFAEMLKGKPWTPEILKQVGGAEGVGVTFLEETLSARTAPPSYRIHQKAAQAVLKALLPETGSNIKGSMRSSNELLEVSGYRSRPNEFDELIRILDSELRLITPTEPEGSESDGQSKLIRILSSELKLITPTELEKSEGEGQTKTQVGEKFFLLTHDYLVPSIGEWLTRKQKETRKGRAELLLADRSWLWNAKPESRHLPSLLEWAKIRLLTRKMDWTEPQKKMMKRADWVHGLRTLGVAAGVLALLWIGIDIRVWVGESNQETFAAGLVGQVVRSDIAQVPGIVRSMEEYRRWVDPALNKLVEQSSESTPERLHASLALLPVDVGQVEYLCNRLLNATPTELPVIRNFLKPHQASLTPKLWSALDSAKPGDVSLLPAASALADYDATSSRWESVGDKVAQALVSVNPVYLGGWLDALRPVREKLNTSLAAIFRDRQHLESERSLATDILKEYASEDPNLIADLLMDSDSKAYAAFFPIAQRHAAKTLPLFEAEINKKVTITDSDKDSETVMDRLAERQARAAIALLRLGKVDEVIPLLRHSADPRLRSFIVNWLNPLGTDPRVIVAELDRIPATARPTPSQGQQLMDAILFHPETSIRRALIQAIGTYGTEGLSQGEREPLIGKLLDLYQNDPDAGIHGAVEWTLRKWGQQGKLKEVDAELMKLKDRGDRRWYVNSQDQTFAVIEGPVEFSMGSPPTEPERFSIEILHRRIIPRRFAIAAKEVTVGQYQEFVKENPGVDHANNDRYSPDPNGPMNGVSWYDAAAYCNWLSRKENLPECYEPNNHGQFAEGMTIRADALSRTGYRLPTEAEWEYACRSGTGTSRYYGESVNMLGHYAWFLDTSPDRAQPCGSLLPNDLGLFDILGNVYEWCQEQDLPYEPGKGALRDEINIQLSIIKKHARLIRGGTFIDPPAYVRSAFRNGLAPSSRYFNGGFRPSRTHP